MDVSLTEFDDANNIFGVDRVHGESIREHETISVNNNNSLCTYTSREISNIIQEREIFLKAILQLLDERDTAIDSARINRRSSDTSSQNDLLKSGVLKKCNGRSILVWKEKFVELRYGLFTYEDDVGWGDAHRKKTIPLTIEKCRCRAVEHGSDGNWKLEISLTNGRQRIWMSSSEAERDSWVQAINTAIIGSAGDFNISDDHESGDLNKSGQNSKLLATPHLQQNYIPYAEELERYNQIRGRISKARSVIEYQKEIQNIHTKKLTLPVYYLKENDNNSNTGKRAYHRPRTSKTNTPMHHSERVLTAANKRAVLREQVWKDLPRDVICVNGDIISGDRGAEAMVGAVVRHVLAQADEIRDQLQERGGGKFELSEGEALSCVRDVLLAFNRTESGGDSYLCTSALLGNSELAVITPIVMESEPMHIVIDIVRNDKHHRGKDNRSFRAHNRGDSMASAASGDTSFVGDNTKDSDIGSAFDDDEEDDSEVGEPVGILPDENHNTTTGHVNSKAVTLLNGMNDNSTQRLIEAKLQSVDVSGGSNGEQSVYSDAQVNFPTSQTPSPNSTTASAIAAALKNSGQSHVTHPSTPEKEAASLTSTASHPDVTALPALARKNTPVKLPALSHASPNTSKSRKGKHSKSKTIDGLIVGVSDSSGDVFISGTYTESKSADIDHDKQDRRSRANSSDAVNISSHKQRLDSDSFPGFAAVVPEDKKRRSGKNPRHHFWGMFSQQSKAKDTNAETNNETKSKQQLAESKSKSALSIFPSKFPFQSSSSSTNRSNTGSSVEDTSPRNTNNSGSGIVMSQWISANTSGSGSRVSSGRDVAPKGSPPSPNTSPRRNSGGEAQWKDKEWRHRIQTSFESTDKADIHPLSPSMCIRIRVRVKSRYRICAADPQDEDEDTWGVVTGCLHQLFFVKSNCNGRPAVSDRLVTITLGD